MPLPISSVLGQPRENVSQHSFRGANFLMPLIFNLRRDPYERSQITSNTYYDWLIDRAFLLVPAQAYVGQFLATFRDYPPRQKAASFSLDQVMEKMLSGGAH